jgi:hypothetical protein
MTSSRLWSFTLRWRRSFAVVVKVVVSVPYVVPRWRVRTFYMSEGFLPSTIAVCGPVQLRCMQCARRKYNQRQKYAG